VKSGKELSEFVESRLSKWHSLFQNLVQIPSYYEAEHKIADFIETYTRSLGLKPIQVLHDPKTLRSLPDAQAPISRVKKRRSVVVRVPGKGRGRSLILNCHVDIVPEGDVTEWHHPPFSGHINREKQEIYGRGAMDDKAGAVICFAVMETVLKFPLELSGDLIFQFVIEDETTGNGSLLCLHDDHTADAAFIIDGSRMDKAINEHAGVMEFSLSLRGKPVSVSVSHIGINAAEVLSALTMYLKEEIFALNKKRKKPWTIFPSPYQLVLHKFHSDGRQFTVPDFASAQCDLIFPPPHSLSSMREFLTEKAIAFAEKNKLPYAAEFDWDGFAVEPVKFMKNKLIRARENRPWLFSLFI